MTIAQSIEEMRDKLRNGVGDEVDYMTDELVKEYYMSWFYGGSGGCSCNWEDKCC